MSGLPQMMWFCNILVYFSNGPLAAILVNNRLYHYCKMFLVVKLVNLFDKNLFLNKMHAVSCKDFFNGWILSYWGSISNSLFAGKRSGYCINICCILEYHSQVCFVGTITMQDIVWSLSSLSYFLSFDSVWNIDYLVAPSNAKSMRC